MTYGTLDPDDPAQVAEYERGFYLAYASLTDNTLVRRIWEWDDVEGRVRTRIPYRDQIVYCWRDGAGLLAGAMAVNLVPERTFQAAAFGFTPPSPPASDSGAGCEILNVMGTRDGCRWTRSTYADFVQDFVYSDLALRGFDVAYSTCTRRRLRPYVFLGAEMMNRECIDGEERFFLRWPVRPTSLDLTVRTGQTVAGR